MELSNVCGLLSPLFFFFPFNALQLPVIVTGEEE